MVSLTNLTETALRPPVASFVDFLIKMVPFLDSSCVQTENFT